MRNGNTDEATSETSEASEASMQLDNIREPRYAWTFHFGFAVLSLVEYIYTFAVVN